MDSSGYAVDDSEYMDPTTFDEKLVEEIRRYPELYDNKHPDYHEFVKKDSLWKDVALTLDVDVADCKRRWRSLRDNYRRYQKDPEKNLPSAGRRRNLYVQLSFLENVQVKRGARRYGMIALKKTKRIKSESNSTENPVIVRYGGYPDTTAKTDVDPSPDLSRWESEVYQPKTAAAVQYFVLKPDNVKTPLDPQTEQVPQDHEIDNFLKLMGQTIKKFLPQFQIEAKKKIFDCITEIELRNYQESSKSSNEAT